MLWLEIQSATLSLHCSYTSYSKTQGSINASHHNTCTPLSLQGAEPIVLSVLSPSHVDALIVCEVNTRWESAAADSQRNSSVVCWIMCLHHEWCDDACHVQEAQQLVPVLPLKCFRRVYLWLYLSTTFTQSQPPAPTQLRSNGLSIITLRLP